MLKKISRKCILVEKKTCTREKKCSVAWKTSGKMLHDLTSWTVGHDKKHIFHIVEPPLTTIFSSLGTTNLYIDSYLKPLYNGHLFTMPSFFSPSGGCCRDLRGSTVPDPCVKGSPCILLLNIQCYSVCWKELLDISKPVKESLACENSRFSSLFAAEDVSRFLRAKLPQRRRVRMRNDCFCRLRISKGGKVSRSHKGLLVRLRLRFSYYLVNVGGWEEMHILQEKNSWQVKY